jgi:hypothetical protein
MCRKQTASRLHTSTAITTQNGLVPTAAAWNTSCDFVEVVGASVQRSANGLYQKKQADQDRSVNVEDRPVYVHTSGLLYISFLSSICVQFAYVSCSPGWVVSETSAGVALGLKWKEAGSEKPSGTEIKSELLAAALQKQVEFKKEEWEVNRRG